MKDLIIWVNMMIKKYPKHKTDIIGSLQLCEDEIEEGGSQTHEIELCKESIMQIVGEK